MKNGLVCSVWLDSLTHHIKRSLDHPNSVCTAARQPRTLKHWHILQCATEGVLTQNTPKQKPEAYVTKLPSFQHGRHLGKDSQRGPFSKRRLCGVACACLCVHTVCGGRGAERLIRAHGGGIGPASYNKQQRFDQIKAGLPLMPPCMPPSRASIPVRH